MMANRVLNLGISNSLLVGVVVGHFVCRNRVRVIEVRGIRIVKVLMGIKKGSGRETVTVGKVG
jgi:hypothetical protein